MSLTFCFVNAKEFKQNNPTFKDVIHSQSVNNIHSLSGSTPSISIIICTRLICKHEKKVCKTDPYLVLPQAGVMYKLQYYCPIRHDILIKCFIFEHIKPSYPSRKLFDLIEQHVVFKR